MEVDLSMSFSVLGNSGHVLSFLAHHTLALPRFMAGSCSQFRGK
jgi:hypothetical protein